MGLNSIRRVLGGTLGKNFFPEKVAKLWHRLPSAVVESSSLERFKRRADVVLNNISNTVQW